MRRSATMCATVALLSLLAVYGLYAAGDVKDGPFEKSYVVTAKREGAPDEGAKFALDLYGRLRQKPGNVFISPFSIRTALAMTYAGAEGETAAEMAKVLRLDRDKEKGSARMSALMKVLDEAGKAKGCELNIANSLWAQMGYPFRPDFLAGIKERYDGGFNEVDFTHATEQARKTINAWVEEKTKDKIKELILKEQLTPLTRLVLVNAIYFKGDWVLPFKKEQTKNETFRVSDTAGVAVPMMRQTKDFGYLETDGFQALKLPYAGDRLEMVVFLPKKVDGLDAFEKSLTAEKLGKWLKSLRHREIDVQLPRFTMTIRYDELARTLAEMGMPLAFHPDKADFSGMTTAEKVFISKVIHKAFIKVNEKGTEAAAATAVIMEGEAIAAPPPVFRADHPFFFVIRDRRTGSVLFMGRLVDPKG